MGRFNFTPREEAVLELLLRGASNREICEDLSLDARTVKSYVSNIAGKLGILPDEYATRVRIVYIVSHQRGLLPNWPRP